MNGSFIKRSGGVKAPDRACVLSHVARILELVAIPQLVKNLPAVQETQVRSLGQEISPGEGNGNPLQNSCLDNPMDREARWATAQGITRSQTRPNIHSHICHFSILG